MSDSPHFHEEDLLPLRYLNDLLFCERRAALHLLEQIWKENQFTAEGQYAHRRVDKTADLKRGDKRDVTVPAGSIFHVRSQHRREVVFANALRRQTIDTAAQLHQLVKTQTTPPAEWKARCKGCSLLEICMPKVWRPKATARRYLENLLHDPEPPS